ncbi:cyclic-di-AMP receptor [Eremococcus coleocola]|uniref:Nitrogen regulatory protein P-II n=1 Tax=Eremococcus coleocola ACS-139-V-Col8 TaxID=908337 RepID=E4KR11_9LACT|nr:cyclic-di-AMP receptor [Eremococcus coleocola]EFR30796.1 hypothetical protein HMPREF9257_0723 [Eremococcus coleocola ACS-139-V-Col8]
MKLIIAIVQDQDESILGSAFREANVRATKLSTTGGFLKSGNTTFLVGTEDDKVKHVLSIIEDNCRQREQYVATPANYDINLDMTASFPVKVDVGGAIVFVMPIDEFHRF